MHKGFRVLERIYGQIDDRSVEGLTDEKFEKHFKDKKETTLQRALSKEYLKDPKIVARMINRSPQKVKAYWFFTPKTVPDK